MNRKMNRRQFLGTTSAAGGILVVKPELVRGTAANSAVRLGFLGCGGRGTGVATAMVNNTNTRVVALADLFSDQLEKAKRYFDDIAQKKGYAGIDSKLIYRGPKAYQEIAQCKEADAILISTPDFFHAEHLDAVVDAGKHVYCEKPAGVDVVSCKRFLEIGKRAEGRLSLAVGFNVRWASQFTELIRRVQAGAASSGALAPSIMAMNGSTRDGSNSTPARSRKCASAGWRGHSSR